jgi:hypothetical protein
VKISRVPIRTDEYRGIEDEMTRILRGDLKC